jgi:hypothetical protein
MSTSENESSINNDNKNKALAEYSGISMLGGGDEEGVSIHNLGETQYAIRPRSEGRKPPGSSVINIVKNDRTTSRAAKQQAAGARYESLVQLYIQRLQGGSGSSSVLTKIEEDDITPAMAVELLTEAKRRLAVQRVEQDQDAEIERQRRFRERLQRYKDVCPDCNTTLGFQPGSLENHQKTCDAYLKRLRREDDERNRRQSIVGQFERIERAIDSLSSNCRTLRENLSNFKFIDAQAMGSKDKVANEALEKIREEINSASEYEKGRRKWKVENMRALADSLTAFYAWFGGTQPNRESS